MTHVDEARADLDLALIGNSSFSALIDSRARIVWACLPRFDSAPVFDRLLRSESLEESPDGHYTVELVDCARTEQEYINNTAVVRTILHDTAGGAIEVLDFAPRFEQYGRVYRPLMIVRLVRPLSGSPRVRVRLAPTRCGDEALVLTYGSNHVRYVMPHTTLRLTTDASISAVLDESAFLLDHPMTFVLGPDETLAGGLHETGRHLYEETVAHWHGWVRGLAIPFEWQEAVIRAAITLKLNAFEDTGAIVAAMTTSIPEASGSERNWDYRFCWLRDAQFVVGALNRLGTTQTMERYLRYIVNIAASSSDGHLQPVYGINGRAVLEERTVEALSGYRGMGPVRFGNLAYLQEQHDVYGSTVLAATHVFFDRRLEPPGDEALFRRLERLGSVAVEVFGKPDSGPWELRGERRVHTYSAVMCWAACDRLAKIARRLGLADRALEWTHHARRMHEIISAKAWNEKMGTFVESFGGKDLDATLLLLAELGFLRNDDPRFEATVEAVEEHLLRDGYLYRYVIEDDFGVPETAFTVCSFWYVDALHALGRDEKARALFERLLSRRNRHGLLSEDIDTKSGELWGNFPQTYSMVGLVNSARKLSRSWEEAF